MNNNTANTVGKSHIIGTIRHKLNMALNLPYCGPLTLDVTDDIDNTMNFYPK